MILHYKMIVVTIIILILLIICFCLCLFKNNKNKQLYLDLINFPNAKRVNTNKVHMYIIDNFLSKQECDMIINKMKTNLRPSTITNKNEPDKYYRTSKTSDLKNSDPFIKKINNKICDYIGIPNKYSETLQGQYYDVGNEFKKHTDYFKSTNKDYKKYLGKQGQRTWTFMIYLNNVKEGGETEFPKLNLKLKPTQGKAVIWCNLNNNKSVNPYTLHIGKPVIKGEKYIITKWFREYDKLFLQK